MDYKMVEQTADFLRSKGVNEITAGIVLGTGLGKLIDKISVICSIPYHQIPHFPEASVEFHKGQLIYGLIGKTYVLAMQGRFHYYEGYSMQQISFPIRVMKALGTQYLLLSNAAGGINKDFKKGDLVLLTDHINMFPDNPLRGLNDPKFGPRFPDMSCPYNKELTLVIKEMASSHHIELKEGIYAAVIGPNLETRAEYRFIRNAGADLVGMSTVPEVIVANQIALPCAAISVVTDECDPDNLQPADFNDIIAVAGKADEALSVLFTAVIKKLLSEP